MPLLELKDLKTYYETRRGVVKAVDGINLSIERKDALGLAGESGCGKTTVALSVMRLLPHNGRIVDGSIIFDGINLLKLEDNVLRKNIRWRRISMIFQGAMNALNPVQKIGDQIAEAILLHEDISKEEARERVSRLLSLMGIPSERANSYPYELSGGMRQRIMIAMALACNPDLIIADEPSTALDVITQAQILELIDKLRKKLNLTLILITHDLSVIAEICNKIGVMYAGKIVEYGDITKIYRDPFHPYTKALINAFPSVTERKELHSIPGSPPNLINPPPGCRFHPRCPYAKDVCKEKEPILNEVGEKRLVACHLIGG